MRCPTHLCIGHEAIAAGVCANLEKNDVVLSNHRSHGHYLAKGGDLKRMLAEIYGKATGASGGMGGSQHLIDLSVNFYGSTPIVGGTIPVATGVAWADKLRKLERVTVVFFGGAAVEEGVFYESLNFASLHQLPIFYVCENNFYSIFTHISDRQPKRDIYKLVQAQGIFALREDGNNLLKVFDVANKAVNHVRKKRKPAFIEFITYRLKEHCGPNDELPGERPVEELEYWKKRDPLLQFEKRLSKQKILTEKKIKKIKEKIEKEIKEAFDFARESPYPEEKAYVS